MPRQRVEVVGLRGIPGVMGGVEAHCEELVPRIAALAPDLDIEVVARSRYVRTSNREFRGVAVKPLYAPRRQSSEAIVSTFLGVLRARARGARLIHIHGIGPALLTPLARMLGMPVVVTHHSLNYDHSKWGRFGRAMLRLGERNALRFADRVIAVAPWLARRLRRLFPEQEAKVTHIPNGRPTFPNEDDGGTILKELGLPSRGYVLAVGRLVPEKAFHVLIEAMAIANWPLPLVICGAADHESRYSRDLLEKASAECLFAGPRPRSALKTLYEHAALFVLPSEHEGMPLAALEAASFGCPILLSDIEPNRDLGLPPKHYFPAGDAAAIAERLNGDPLRYSVDPARFDRFDWDSIAEQTLAVYRSALGRSD